jgi:hypothetical protein
MAINSAISHTRCEDNAGVAISFEGSIEVKESRLHAKRFRDLAIRWLNRQAMAAKVKNYLFNKARVGTIDLHYRDYEEPPGNGGFLLNGGRLYLDIGHFEYASPECLHLHDLVTYEMAGDELLRSSLAALEAGDRVKGPIDVTGLRAFLRLPTISAPTPMATATTQGMTPQSFQAGGTDGSEAFHGMPCDMIL